MEHKQRKKARLIRLYLGIYTNALITYMHLVTMKKGNRFEREQGLVCVEFWKEESDGRLYVTVS